MRKRRIESSWAFAKEGKRKCSVCKETKPYIFSEVTKNGVKLRHKYTDGVRKTPWSGPVCPDCRRKKYASYCKSPSKKVEGKRYNPYEGKRSCTLCGTKTHNYFYCSVCHTKVSNSVADMSDLSLSSGVVLSVGYKETLTEEELVNLKS